MVDDIIAVNCISLCNITEIELTNVTTGLVKLKAH